MQAEKGSRKWVRTSQPSRAQAVEGRLSTLQNAHRLAIHVWEHETDPAYLFPRNLRTQLDMPYPPRIEAVRGGLKPILHSMSLLPPNTAKPLKPFSIASHMLPLRGAYVFDLSQKGDATLQSDTPALVPRVLDQGLYSQDNNYNKEFAADKNTASPALRTHQKGKSTTELLRQCGGEKGSEISRQMLDALGKHITQPNPIFSQKKWIDWNELLASARIEHVQALVVPSLNQHNPKTHPQHYAQYEQVARLCAAILGLQHVDHGVEELPVALYHVSGKDKGQITYIGQEREELRGIALDALQRLQTQEQQPLSKETLCNTICEALYEPDLLNGHLPAERAFELEILSNRIREHLGVDMYRPVGDQITTADTLLMQRATQQDTQTARG